MYPVIDAADWREFRSEGVTGRLEKQTLVSADDHVYIFKWPEEFGEAWAEKLAAEVGTVLGLPMAEVEFGRRRHPRTGATLGTLSRDFRYDGTRARNEICESGSVLLQEHIPGYRIGEHYSYQRVRRVLDDLRVLGTFHRMLLLDALLCNIDRHDDNWELLDRRRMAPIFDSGRCEAALLVPRRQGRFVANEQERLDLFAGSRSALGWEPEGEGHLYWPGHLVFLEGLRDEFPDDFAVAVEPFLTVDAAQLDQIVDEVPREFIHEDCRRLAKIMLRERLDAIRGLA